jgi:hypothetical protein
VDHWYNGVNCVLEAESELVEDDGRAAASSTRARAPRVPP